jgi:hypothetical protein
MNKERFYPKSVYKELIPVLEYGGEIISDTPMVFRNMRSITQVKYDEHGMPHYFHAGYKPIRDMYNEEMYREVSADFYLKYYHGNTDMREEILHHNFCVVGS